MIKSQTTVIMIEAQPGIWKTFSEFFGQWTDDDVLAQIKRQECEQIIEMIKNKLSCSFALHRGRGGYMYVSLEYSDEKYMYVDGLYKHQIVILDLPNGNIK